MAAMEPLHRAREAFAARRWDVAYAAYRACDGLSGDDLDALAEAAHWLGRPDESIVAYTEAYRLHREAGDERRASLSALLIACHLRFQGAGVEADGWLARCVRLLSEVEEGAEHGYPLHLEIPSLLAVDPVAAEASARRMQDLGDRYGDDSLVALGVFYEGRALVKQARVREGLAMLDEAMLAAVSDELKPIWTGVIYCGLLDACHELVDLRRAQEWTEAMSRWCAPLPAASLYPGICRVHRVEILDLRGAWEDAEAEASAACGDLVGIDVFAVADGHYLIGELRRRRGDLPPPRRRTCAPMRRDGIPSRGWRCCGSPRGGPTPRPRRSPRRWSPAPAAGWSGHGCSRHRSTSRSPRATSVSPRLLPERSPRSRPSSRATGCERWRIAAGAPSASPRASPCWRWDRCGWRSRRGRSWTCRTRRRARVRCSPRRTGCSRTTTRPPASAPQRGGCSPACAPTRTYGLSMPAMHRRAA